MEKVDFCIAGGGIVGLFIAKKILDRYPDKSVFVLEKSQYLGDESTGRNSGVLHGGMYYQTASLKHKLCIAGNKQWKQLAKAYDFKINECGKYIIACTKSEIDIINDIFERGQTNGVPDFRRASADEIAMLKEYTYVEDALFSSFTGYIDAPGAVKELDKIVTNLGGFILKSEKVVDLKSTREGVLVKTSSSDFIAEKFINSAGLGAVELRKFLGLTDVENRFVKGSYLKTTQNYYKDSLIYPVPFKDQKGLGVHTVINPEGEVLFGPNAEVVDEIDYEVKEDAVDSLKNAISKTFKGIDEEKLRADYSGIRTQIVYKGETYNDFWIKGPRELNISGYFELLSIESPGLTSAPAIADYVLDLISPQSKEN